MRLFVGIVAALAVSGCASMMEPRSGENGERLVFVNKINGAWVAPGSGAIGGSAVSGPVAGGHNPMAAGAVTAGASLLVQLFRGPEVILEIFDHDTTEADAPRITIGRNRIIQRKPYPELSRLQLRSWAILALDENGDDIVLPCPSACRPVK